MTERARRNAIAFVPCRTMTRFGTFDSVFPKRLGSQSCARLARLSVLYEDFKIEVGGLSAAKFEVLDTNGEDYRFLYFIRRAVGTLVEFEEAFRLLAQCSSSHAETPAEVERLEHLFHQHRVLLKKLRNDVSGHFGNDAATHALENIEASYIAKMHVEVDTFDRRRVSLPFATEIAIAAFLRHAPGDSAEEKAGRLFDILVDGLNFVRAAMPAVLDQTWGRLGR